LHTSLVGPFENLFGGEVDHASEFEILPSPQTLEREAEVSVSSRKAGER
jgi:hypothetical protein